MKIFPNLAGSLRFYFGLTRALIIVFAAFWLVTLTFGPSIRKFFGAGPGLMVAVGEASLQTAPNAVGLSADSASPGSLLLGSLRGSLQIDLLTKDDALLSALRWTVFPSIAVLVAFSWLLFGSLRTLCANIERREVFSENNLRLVRNIGWILIGYNLTGFAVQLLASYVMGGYLSQHVALTGLQTGLQFPGGLGAVRLSFPGGQFPGEIGLVTGGVVLMLSEAFRQGLNLKSENDLTV
jgi:hypothetical protein